VVTVLYASALLLGLLGLYRPLWRRRHVGAGGVICRRGRVQGSELVAGELRLPMEPDRGMRDGDAVVLVGLEVGNAFQLIRVRRGAWPELRWLRWAPAAAAVLLAAALALERSEARDPPAGLGLRVQVSRRVRAPVVRPGPVPAPSLVGLRDLRRRLRPLQQPLGRPAPGDWLAQHHEAGQTFEQYLRSEPTHARGRRRVLYVQPIGEFAGKQKEILSLTADFISRYLCLETRVARPIPLSLIPAGARRRHPVWGGEQILTGYLLQNVLEPRLPGDAAAYIGFTAADLWPGRGWNFVFGEASLRDRVGVWSIHRHGDPSEDFELCLLRTIKTAVHETGHMLSMHHCTAHRCNMGGSNSLAESDRGPVTLCAECLSKLIWATGCDPVARYRGLARFFRERRMTAQQRAYERLLRAIQR
jgi:archaemetzincin